MDKRIVLTKKQKELVKRFQEAFQALRDGGVFVATTDEELIII